MQADMRAALFRVLGACSPPWERTMDRSGLRILAYHDVPAADPFRAQMADLVERFTPITHDDVQVHLESARPLPPGAVWVTFDDGAPSVVDIAQPILDELGIPATIFVCPSVIDTSQPLWWQILEIAERTPECPSISPAELKRLPDSDRRRQVSAIRRVCEQRSRREINVPQLSLPQLEKWLDAGHTIGNHTWDHPLLDMCDPAEQERQIVDAHNWIRDKLGLTPNVFAYPNGNWTAAAEMVLTDLGYQFGLLFDHRISGTNNPLKLSRIRVNSEDPLYEFRARTSGIHPAILRIRSRIRAAGRK